jgi:hypothetical protein
MGKHHRRVHDAFTELKRPLDPVKVYETMCKLVKLSEDVIERGLGKLFRDGRLSNPRPKGGRKAKRGPSRRGAGLDIEDLR